MIGRDLGEPIRNGQRRSVERFPPVYGTVLALTTALLVPERVDADRGVRARESGGAKKRGGSRTAGDTIMGAWAVV